MQSACHRLLKIGFILAVACASQLIVSAQSTRFDVASVKSNTSGDEAIRWMFENGRFTGTNVTVRLLISTAYGPPQQPLDFLHPGGSPRSGSTSPVRPLRARCCRRFSALCSRIDSHSRHTSRNATRQSTRS
jgi:hypothetical protein